MKCLQAWLDSKNIILLLLIGMSACTLLFDQSIPLLSYDQMAIRHGEIWRLLTAHFIHLNIMHLVLNVVGIGVVLYIFEDIKLKDWAILSLFSAFFISILLFLLDKNIQWYVGFSGVLHAWFVYGAMNTLFRKRWFEGLAILILICIKITYEQTIGASPLSISIIQNNVVVNAHLYGAVVGFFFAFKILLRN